MKALLKQDFAWCHDGITAIIIPGGTVVESPVAENAVQMGLAEVYEEKAVEPPANKAAPAPQNKAAFIPKRK